MKKTLLLVLLLLLTGCGKTTKGDGSTLPTLTPTSIVTRPASITEEVEVDTGITEEEYNISQKENMREHYIICDDRITNSEPISLRTALLYENGFDNEKAMEEYNKILYSSPVVLGYFKYNLDFIFDSKADNIREIEDIGQGKYKVHFTNDKVLDAYMTEDGELALDVRKDNIAMVAKDFEETATSESAEQEPTPVATPYPESSVTPVQN